MGNSCNLKGLINAKEEIKGLLNNKEINTGTQDYNELENLPSINGIQIKGNITLEDLKIQPKGNYVEKEEGKELSSNDFTDEDQKKLNNIEDGAEVNIIDSISINGVEKEIENKSVNITVPTKVSELDNDNKFVDDKYVTESINEAIGNVLKGEY